MTAQEQPDTPELSSPHPPASAELSHLQARDRTGLFYLLWTAGLTSAGLALSMQHPWPLFLLGQTLLAVALLEWFVLLHEAGHQTLFRTPLLNRCTGHHAGFFAVNPFPCWKLVHGMHHHWTGWQDLDLTTATLVARRLSLVERIVVNGCWWTWLPLFSVLYRVNNYWNLFRMFAYFPHRHQRRQLFGGVGVLAAVYGLTVYLLGPLLLVQLAGLALFLTLVLQDPLILSQHTHVPMQRSDGEAVKPFSPAEQEVFTRSLKFPGWFARLILLNLDAHELHHMYPRVPGYDLHRIAYVPRNRIHWRRWLVQAKRLSGEVFLFQNRLQSGHHL
jgi:fatty acid desaturase